MTSASLIAQRAICPAPGRLLVCSGAAITLTTALLRMFGPVLRP